MKVFLSGEGPEDLGDWYREPEYRGQRAPGARQGRDPPKMGVIEAILRKAVAIDFTVVDACVWKRIRKFKSGKHARPETRNVLGLVLQAEEAGCDALVFVRDQDGDSDRQTDVEEGVRLATGGAYSPSIVGGVAIQEIEAWVLALLGERGSERYTDAKAALVKKRRITSSTEKVAAVETADRNSIPDDAISLRNWMQMAVVAFVMKR
jgi:hypothetical protein